MFHSNKTKNQNVINLISSLTSLMLQVQVSTGEIWYMYIVFYTIFSAFQFCYVDYIADENILFFFPYSQDFINSLTSPPD